MWLNAFEARTQDWKSNAPRWAMQAGHDINYVVWQKWLLFLLLFIVFVSFFFSRKYWTKLYDILDLVEQTEFNYYNQVTIVSNNKKKVRFISRVTL